MEKMPSREASQEESLDVMYKRTNREAVEKRPEFLTSLDKASTLEEIRTAVEEYAVNEGDIKVIVNFLEGAYSDKNETDGREFLADILSSIDKFEKDKPDTRAEVEGEIFNYALSYRIAQILGVDKD